MLRVSTEARRTLRYCILGLATAATALAMSVDTADARRRHRHRSSYSPPFSSVVVDVNSGSTLQANNADSQRHPASLTKIMTLYLLFERLETGKMKLDTEMSVSAHASEQAPTKLGLRPGQTLVVEDAIKGLVTKSANDAAVVIAEAIAGDEDDFAKLMTRKARAIGMHRTVYRNASGLPDEEQVTTARDQATLGRAIQERFPKYYRYFATSSFNFRGRTIRNHNKLLGRVEGVDGIKTGYTRSSGFNLVTSMRRGNRHIVAVVLGGRSGGSRDAIMRNLVTEHIADAATRRTAPLIAERDSGETKVAQAEAKAEPKAAPRSAPVPEIAAAPVAEPAPQVIPEGPVSPPVIVAQAAPAPVAKPAPVASSQLSSGVVSSQPLSLMPGSTEPITPTRVKTVQVKSGQARTAAAPSAPLPQAAPAVTASVAPTKAETLPPVPARAETPREVAKVDSPRPNALPPVQTNHGVGTGILGTLPVRQGNAMASADPWPRPPVQNKPGAFPAPVPAAATTAAEPPAATPASAPAPAKMATHSGWIIQVGAFPDEAEARQRLDAARGQAKGLLGRADPFTEPVSKGDRTLYRARFAGFDKDQAEAACRTLKRNEISCITIKN